MSDIIMLSDYATPKIALAPLVAEFMKRVWVVGDSSAILEMFSAKARIRGLEEQDQVGPQEFLRFHKMVREQVQDISITVLQTVEQGEWVALMYRVEAVDRATSAHLSSFGHVMARVVDNQVVEGINFIDFISLFEQSGRLPARTLDHCLLGGRLQLMKEPPEKIRH